MKQLLFCTAILFLSFGCTRTSSTENASNQINIGVIDSLYSKILNEQRKIWVYVPPGASPFKKYPVLYVLDGDGHFYSVAGMIHQLSTVNGNSLLPEMIIVGIPNTDRTRDLTPTNVKVVFGDTTFSKTSGGAGNFRKFISDELIPYIDKQYATTPYRTLIGHSLGGLFAIDAITQQPELFTNYLAIDPSLWWDDNKLGAQANELFGKHKLERKSLYVAIANTMKNGMTIANVREDTAASTDHIRSIINFSTSTETNKTSGLKFKWKYYDEDSHGSVPLIATYDALRYFFSWHDFKGMDEFFDPESTVTATEAITILTAHYKNVSDHFGYSVLPDEGMVNSVGYTLLQNKKPDHAFEFFNLNIVNFPESANVFDSMGDYYLAQKDTVKAIENFTKAVDMGNLPYSKDKLKKLKTLE